MNKMNETAPVFDRWEISNNSDTTIIWSK